MSWKSELLHQPSLPTFSFGDGASALWCLVMRANSRKIVGAISQLSHRPSVVRPSACGIRWSASHTRQWSTPLAKSLAEAVAVCTSWLTYLLQLLTTIQDNRPYSRRCVHASMPHFCKRRILYKASRRSWSIWPKRRLCHIPRNFPGIRRASRSMGCCRMDVSR